MGRVNLLAAGAIVLLFSALSVTPILCDSSHDSFHDWAEWPNTWPNQGGGIRNRREAHDEYRISTSSVSSMSLKWTAYTSYDVSSTPSIDAGCGAVYFSSWDGCLYAVKKDTGALVWKLGGASPPNLANLLCRATPTIAGPLLIFGLFNPCYVLALNRSTGALVWWTILESHPFCVFTQSGTYYQGSFYIGTSSQEESAPPQTCCKFQGAFFRLDAKTGKAVWRTPMLPYNNNQTGLYAGAGIWGSSPAIDIFRRLVYIATGNTYSVPPAVQDCENARLNETNATVPDSCIKPDDHSESIVAIDIDSGKIFWATHLGGFDVWTLLCALSPVPLPNCPTTIGPDYDFGEAPLLLSIKEGSANSFEWRDIVVAGQKSGVVHALDRSNGDIVWQTVAGPGGEGGGASWGMTTDGERVFTSIINSNGKNFTLVPSSKVITWGGWVAMNGSTGKVIWSTANPGPFGTQSPVAHANGVIFGGSTGNVLTDTPSGQIVALDAMTGSVLWQYTTQGGMTGGVSIMDGCIFQPVGVTISALGNGTSTAIHGNSTISLCVPSWY
ncbi:unnamed protein product [Calypogeia fissa]